MLMNQQLRDNEAVQMLRSSHQQPMQNQQMLHNLHMRQSQQASQPNVFKFKKSTEKLTNKRTSSANSKSKRRNNSQSQNAQASQTAAGLHNKTHSLN